MKGNSRYDGAMLSALTAGGRGAIGVLVVWGPAAVAVVDSAFRPMKGSSLAATPPGRPRLGRIGQGLGDEVVAVWFQHIPPVVEIHCHGGSAAMSLAIEALKNAGARVTEAADWIWQQADSPIQAAATVDLALAPTLRTAAILLDQTHGALNRELSQLLVEVRSLPIRPLLDRVERLLDRGKLGIRLTNGWRVVILGRPNVGKSRLLNALAGYQRAIVDPTPGTTRDVIAVSAAFDGWPVEIFDTAGVRTTDDDLEKSGIERALLRAAAADMVLLVLDQSKPLEDEDRTLIADIVPATRIVVANKADLPSTWRPDDLALIGSPCVLVSAEHGTGLDSLMAAIVQALMPVVPAAGAAVPFRHEHMRLLQEAADVLRHGDREGAAIAIRAALGSWPS